jgi:hypothetical protein
MMASHANNSGVDSSGRVLKPTGMAFHIVKYDYLVRFADD